MPIRFRTRELFEPAVNTAEDFTVALRDGVASFACSLWSSFPDFITQGVNPVNSFARAYMNSMCGAVQPPVPPPTVPFTGGQCCDTQYRVDITYTFIRCFNGNIEATGTPNFTVFGKVKGLRFREDPNVSGQWYLELLYEDCAGTEFITLAFSTTRCIRFGGCFTTDSGSPDFDCIDLDASSWAITSIVRTGGAPDTCGDPPPSYNSPEPTSDDLNQTINVTVNDGLDLSLELQYIKVSNEYNFPMGFKVNGNNVTVDIDGITIHAPDGFGSPGGGNNVPPPGSDSGEDGAGGDITKIYEQNEYIVSPDNPPPRTVEQIIEYVLCTDGVLEVITDTIKIGVGNLPFLAVLVGMVKNILTDLCEMPEATLGLPEYYGLQPGANRPAIVYYWKEYIDDTWQSSTYTSTVQHPTAAAIAAIDTLTSITKTIGPHKTFVRLTDGSNIRATGDTPVNSSANFTFLITQVSSSFLPPDLIAATVTSIDTRLTVKTLNLRQIEYYPNGKVDNASPSVRRVVEP